MAYRFDDVEVDAEAFQARKAGVPVPLEPKAFEALLYLVRSGGRLVTKSELQKAVWPDTFVTESALTRLIAQVRRELKDEARDARYIETVPTRGYRFVARLNGAPAAASLVPPRRGRRTTMTVAVGLGVLAAALVLGVAWRPRSARSVAPAADGRILVSTATGFNAYPAISPDGSSVAFCSDRSGALEIWIRGLAPGARELPVTSDGKNNVQPAWSPDGRFLAYTSMGEGGIWVVPALGGVPRQLTRFGSRPVWSPDGKTLAFLSNDMAQVELSGSTTSRIWLVPAAGGEPRPLTARWDPPGGHRSVSFSPDGRRVAFMAGSRVWLLDLDSGKRTALGFPDTDRAPGLPDLTEAGEVVWTRDGRFIIGLGKHWTGFVLWRYDLESGRGEISSSLLVSDPAQSLAHIALAGDGRRMAFAVVTTHPDLLSLPVGEDGAPSREPVSLFPSLSGRKCLPLFSLDGSRLSFQVSRPGEGPVVYTSATDGRNPASAGNVTIMAGASWTRDGRLVLVVKDSPDRRRLVEIDPGSGRERTLREMPPAGWTRLSPDGKEVAFMCGGQPMFAVCVADVAGGEPRLIVAPESGAGWPSWSPDGRQLAVELYDGEDTYVAVVPREGGTPRRVTLERGQSWPHSWTPEGRSVVFAGQRQGIWNVYAVDVESGRERRLTRYERAVVNVRYPAWSPAGDSLVYEYFEATGNVWVAPLPWP